MHKFVVLQVDAYMRYATPRIEKNQVALLELCPGNGSGNRILLAGCARQADTENIIIHHLGECRTVDAFLGAPAIEVPGTIPLVDQLKKVDALDRFYFRIQ